MAKLSLLSDLNLKIPRLRDYDVDAAVVTSCYLCGASEAPSREHIIARTFFKPFGLEDPLILKACEACNNQKSQDEEFISNIFKACTDTAEAKEASRLFLKKADITQLDMTPVNRRTNRRYRALVDLFTPMNVEVVSPEGILLGYQETMGRKITDDDIEKIKGFYTTIAQGLTTLAYGQIYDWEHYDILPFYERTYKKEALEKMGSFFGALNQTFIEIWGKDSESKDLIIQGGHIDSPGKLYKCYLWLISIYNGQTCIVSVIDKRSQQTKGKKTR